MGHTLISELFVVVQLLSHVQLFLIPWTTARPASLFFKLLSIELVIFSICLPPLHRHMFLSSLPQINTDTIMTLTSFIFFIQSVSKSSWLYINQTDLNSADCPSFLPFYIRDVRSFHTFVKYTVNASVFITWNSFISESKSILDWSGGTSIIYLFMCAWVVNSFN